MGIYIVVGPLVLYTPILIKNLRNMKKDQGNFGIDYGINMHHLRSDSDLNRRNSEYVSAINQCKICDNRFDPDDNLYSLSCNDKHTFHSLCIVDLIDSNQNVKCPICSKTDHTAEFFVRNFIDEIDKNALNESNDLL